MRRGLVWSLAASIVVAVAALVATVAAGHTPLLGLDLRGGVSVVLKPQGTANAAVLQQAVNIIDRRVNGLGVANTSVQREGSDVVVELPGIKDPERALSVLEEQAALYFRPVICQIAAQSTPTTTAPSKAPATTVPAGGGTGGTNASGPAISPTQAQSDCSSASSASLPSTSTINDVANQAVILPVKGAAYRYILGPADMKGSAVKGANVVPPGVNGSSSYSVQLTLTSSGASQFDKIAAQRYQYYNKNATTPDPRNLEAIELDGQVLSAPQIESPSFNGVASITGSFSSSEANDLAVALRYGSLPVRFVPQSVQTVSASIGKDSLSAGIFAGIGGIAAVLLYMILYYRALGLVVLAGLGVGGAVLYSIISQLSQSAGLALTLSGVIGIIVSVGITVDSYVVYFERLKDEIRAGRTIRQSVERSFSRAFRTVLTADFVTVLAALILYIFTVGDVRGFAFMLGLSTLLDVLTAFFFIRPAVILVGRRRAFTDARFIGVARGLGTRRPERVPT